MPFFAISAEKSSNPTLVNIKKRANGTGSIQKLSGNRAKPWKAVRNGIFIGTFPTRTAAQKALERLTDADITDKYNYTFREIYDRWLPEHSREITKSGIDGYKGAFKRCAALHEKKFRALRRSDFQAVIIKMEEDGYAKSTCEKVLQLFGQLSDWAIMEGIQMVNHARFCKISAQQKGEGQVFPDALFAKILESTDPAADIIIILTGCGCRPNEFFNAKTEDCFDGYFIGGSKTESGKNRVIPIAGYALPRYRALLDRAREQGCEKLIAAYPGNRNQKNYIKREFKPLMESLGAGSYKLYDCRHTFTTWAIRSGVDKQHLRRILGHADLSTTDKHYTHLEVADILEEAGKVTLF